METSRKLRRVDLSGLKLHQPEHGKLETVEGTDLDGDTRLQQVLHVRDPEDTFHQESSTC